MPLISVVFFGLLGIALALTLGAIFVSFRLLWPAAILSHFVSVLAGFSIGLYLLVIPFFLVAIGIARGAGWLTTPLRGLVAGLAGIAAWAAAIRWIDDYWLFLPYTLLGRVL